MVTFHRYPIKIKSKMSEQPQRVVTVTVEHPVTLQEKLLGMVEFLEGLLLPSDDDEIKFENLPHLMSAKKSLLLLLAGICGVPVITREERRNIRYGFEMAEDMRRRLGISDDEPEKKT